MRRLLPILFHFALLLSSALPLRALDLLPSALSLGRFPANQAQERVFTLRNPSDAAVTIGAVRTSCGCLTADLSNREIPAQSQASLTVRLPAEGLSGPFTHMVFLETDGEVRTVRLTGEAVPLVAVSATHSRCRDAARRPVLPSGVFADHQRAGGVRHPRCERGRDRSQTGTAIRHPLDPDRDLHPRA